MTAFSNPLAVALDTPDLAKAQALARALAPHAGCLKLGMEIFYAHGRAGYEGIAKVGLPIFLDLKLHDIPNTVARSIEALMMLEPPPAIVNVHALGGLAMMKAAAGGGGRADEADCGHASDQSCRRRPRGSGLRPAGRR